MKWIVLSIVALLMLVQAAPAADIAGKWKAEFQAPDGQTRTSTFDFKVDGANLTGTVSNPRGESPIIDGKVNGDEVSFAVVRKFQDQEFKMTYKGKVSGTDMKLTVSMGEDRTFEMTAKKI